MLVDRDVIGFVAAKSSLSITGEKRRRNSVRCP
jgi:hypothetical protein